MKLFKLFRTTGRRTYRKPRQRAGYSTTLTAKTRLKRWARRGRKKLWRTAKRRTKRLWRRLTPKHQARKRQIARRAQQFRRNNAKIHAQNGKHYQPPTPTGGYQVDASGGVSYQPGPAQAGSGKLPPPDGAMASCRRCSNEVEYNGGRERWEHTGKGHYECFQPRRD